MSVLSVGIAIFDFMTFNLFYAMSKIQYFFQFLIHITRPYERLEQLYPYVMPKNMTYGGQIG